MILLVTHFTENKGVTDFFVEYLKRQRQDFYLLRHPFTSTDLKFSELYLYAGGTWSLIKKYKKINNDSINLIKNFFVSIRVLYILNKRVDKIIAFGSFNAVPFIFFNRVFNNDVYFWGVDYSSKRFRNIFLNKLYLFFETLSCTYCSAVINQTQRQEVARIQSHNLKKNKSIVITNGIEIVNLNKDFSEFDELAFLYIGSINHEHGVIDFIKHFYIKNNFHYSLYIIGGGEEVNILEQIIKYNSLDGTIHYLGYKNQQEIIDFLLSLNKKLFGIAPYNGNLNDCVCYGDSLKIKEYLNYNSPYIINSIVYVPKELEKFGIVYGSLDELSESLEERLRHFKLNLEEKNAVLSTYKWEDIFKKVAQFIKI